jgi:hypothetical protein
MKILLASLILRSFAATFCVGFLLSMIAACTTTAALIAAAPFVDDTVEAQISGVVSTSWSGVARYSCCLFSLAVFGAVFYSKNEDQMEIAKELLALDRALIQAKLPSATPL